MSIFKDKVLLITGGTGSFGNAVLRRFLDSDIKEIRNVSRSEKNKIMCVINCILKRKKLNKFISILNYLSISIL